ncbi:30S ribosomal protein S27e [Candidatus Woesearchaeota archaeon]|nr:30S ribosomal protein S27e [Candidatus Woesearchaeota archaeon]
MKQRKNKSQFFKVRCNKCKNEQNVFNKCSSEIKCLVCDEILAMPTGGKSKVIAKILEALE